MTNYTREAVPRPFGGLTIHRLHEFAKYYRATMSPEAAHEAIEFMYLQVGPDARKAHLEQQRVEESGGIYRGGAS